MQVSRSATNPAVCVLSEEFTEGRIDNDLLADVAAMNELPLYVDEPRRAASDLAAIAAACRSRFIRCCEIQAAVFRRMNSARNAFRRSGLIYDRMDFEIDCYSLISANREKAAARRSLAAAEQAHRAAVAAEASSFVPMAV